MEKQNPTSKTATSDPPQEQQEQQQSHIDCDRGTGIRFPFAPTSETDWIGWTTTTTTTTTTGKKKAASDDERQTQKTKKNATVMEVRTKTETRKDDRKYGFFPSLLNHKEIEDDNIVGTSGQPRAKRRRRREAAQNFCRDYDIDDVPVGKKRTCDDDEDGDDSVKCYVEEKENGRQQQDSEEVDGNESSVVASMTSGVSASSSSHSATISSHSSSSSFSDTKDEYVENGIITYVEEEDAPKKCDNDNNNNNSANMTHSSVVIEETTACYFRNDGIIAPGVSLDSFFLGEDSMNTTTGGDLSIAPPTEFESSMPPRIMAPPPPVVATSAAGVELTLHFADSTFAFHGGRTRLTVLEGSVEVLGHIMREKTNYVPPKTTGLVWGKEEKVAEGLNNGGCVKDVNNYNDGAQGEADADEERGLKCEEDDETSVLIDSPPWLSAMVISNSTTGRDNNDNRVAANSAATAEGKGKSRIRLTNDPMLELTDNNSASTRLRFGNVNGDDDDDEGNFSSAGGGGCDSTDNTNAHSGGVSSPLHVQLLDPNQIHSVLRIPSSWECAVRQCLERDYYDGVKERDGGGPEEDNHSVDVDETIMNEGSTVTTTSRDVLSSFPPPRRSRNERAYLSPSPRILICGAKGCGKSTLLRYAVNRLLGSLREKRRRQKKEKQCHRRGSQTRKWTENDNENDGNEAKTRNCSQRCLPSSLPCPGVAILDCDAGQPELSPPGMLTLTVVNKPLLSTPHIHMVSGGSGSGGRKMNNSHSHSHSKRNDIEDNTIRPAATEHIRAYYYGSTSSKDDPARYIRLISFLVDAYEKNLVESYLRDSDDGNYDYHDNELEDPEYETVLRSTEGNNNPVNISPVLSTPPLVVNTDGWVKSMGADILSTIIDLVNPDHIIQIVGTTRSKMFDLSHHEKVGRVIHVVESGVVSGARHHHHRARLDHRHNHQKIPPQVHPNHSEDICPHLDLVTADAEINACTPASAFSSSLEQHGIAPPTISPSDLRVLRLCSYFLRGRDSLVDASVNDDDRSNNIPIMSLKKRTAKLKKRYHHQYHHPGLEQTGAEFRTNRGIVDHHHGIAHALSCMRPYRVPLESVTSYVLGWIDHQWDGGIFLMGCKRGQQCQGQMKKHEEEEENLLLDVMNGNIVGLCVSSSGGDLGEDTQRQVNETHNSVEFMVRDDGGGRDVDDMEAVATDAHAPPPITANSVLPWDRPCVGLGIVRSIDTRRKGKKMLYILTPVAPHFLSNVDTLLIGHIALPIECIFRGVASYSEAFPHHACETMDYDEENI